MLAEAVRQVDDTENRPVSYLCASGIGIYGQHYFQGTKDVAAEGSMDTADTIRGILATVSRHKGRGSQLCSIEKNPCGEFTVWGHLEQKAGHWES